jgi:hypothetical protein
VKRLAQVLSSYAIWPKPDLNLLCVCSGEINLVAFFNRFAAVRPETAIETPKPEWCLSRCERD